MSLNANLSLQFYISIALWLCFNISTTSGQQDSLIPSLFEIIQNVKKAQVLVRLESKNNKLEALKNALAHAQAGSDQELRIQNLIHREMAERDSFNLNLVKAMQQRFKFCRVLYYYDKDHSQLRSKEFKAPVFLNPNLERDSLMEFPIDPIFIIAKGKTGDQQLDAFVFLDKESRPIPRPFPEHLRMNTFKVAMNSLFSSSDAHQKNAIYYADKIQSTFAYFDARDAQEFTQKKRHKYWWKMNF